MKYRNLLKSINFKNKLQNIITTTDELTILLLMGLTALSLGFCKIAKDR